MKKQLVLILLVGFLIYPSVTMAAWWNPFSWFKKPNTTQVIEVAKPTNDTAPVVTPTKPAVEERRNTKQPPVIAQKNASKASMVTPKPAQVVESADITQYRAQLAFEYKQLAETFDKKAKVYQILMDSHEYYISDIEDKIAGGEGFKLGNPNSATTVDYMNKLFNIQLEFEKKYLAKQKDFLKWLQESKSALATNQAALPAVNTKENLDAYSKNVQGFKDSISGAEKAAAQWSDQSRKIKTTIDGIIAGLSSSMSSSNTTSLPTVTPTYPTTFVPSTSPYKINCTTTKDFIGQIQTKCY